MFSREYFDYHDQSMKIGDVDPSFKMLRYICDRFELNLEQRFWLAYIYGLTYCGAAVYYFYNEFPDFENVNVDRMERWWSKNRANIMFQTDRMRVKTANNVVPSFVSYQSLVGNGTQESLFNKLMTGKTPEQNYLNVYKKLSEIKHFGRFSMFNYSEAVRVTTDLHIEPDTLSMKEAESCRNGLCFAVGDMVNMNHFTKKDPPKEAVARLQRQFDELVIAIKKVRPKDTVWNIETTLCAFKKYKVGKRFIGFYLDRQKDEIEFHSKNKELAGVDWSVLWQYRKETYNPKYLSELK
jgi:hypothetical protein